MVIKYLYELEVVVQSQKSMRTLAAITFELFLPSPKKVNWLKGIVVIYVGLNSEQRTEVSAFAG